MLMLVISIFKLSSLNKLGDLSMLLLPLIVNWQCGEQFKYLSINNPVVEGRRPKTLTTGQFMLSIPGMTT